MAKLDIVFGKKTNPAAVESLIGLLQDKEWDGTLYVGYPVLSGDDSSGVTDALLTCKKHGVVIFDLSINEFIDLEPGEIEGAIDYRQRELRRKLNSRLVSYENLVKDDGVTLGFKINVITFLPEQVVGVNIESVATPESLVQKLEAFPEIETNFVVPLNAAIQKTAALKPKKKRLNVRDTDSMGSTIKYLESQVANLDRWQKNAAIESPEGPQRIRGLAGSGKTIILAMKAAYLHANDPEAKIVVTFNTRSLYQQFKNLIRRFYFDHVADDPNWDNLQIMHAWGSGSSAGLYSTVSSQALVSATPFGVARHKFGYSAAFKGVCTELVTHLKKIEFKPVFDYVLVDEAQDFPASFFQLIYLATKNPKKIVWAYDELQNLGDSSMPTLDELFGVDDLGQPLIEITNVEGQPKQDILLPICYRNPPWLLSFALGLGLGVKMGNGKFTQMFRDPGFWREIGYEDINNNLELGKTVRLRREADRTAPFFAEKLLPSESITWHQFSDSHKQSEWIAKDIQNVISTQELDLNDILIVIPESLAATGIGHSISGALSKYNIESHLIGVTGSQDIVFVDNSVAMCSIYRAKGNEAPLVYVVNSEFCNSGFDLAKSRNILFTALTRAKAWVRICGVGASMETLVQEMQALVNDNFDLNFKYPTDIEIEKLRNSYREKTSTASEKRKVKKEIESAQKLFRRIADGELDLGDLPADLAELLRKALK